MRYASLLLVLLIALSTVKSGNVNNAATENDPKEQSFVATASVMQQSPPAGFDPYRTPWDHFVVMPEEQSLNVGTLDVDCGEDCAHPANFVLLPPTPSFVRIVPDFCACSNINIQRAAVIVFPRRGDRGTYTVIMAAGPFGGVGQQFGFTLKVKKAPQE